MAIAGSAAYEEEIAGARRRLLLRNGEIERFEEQYAPFGVFGLWDQLMGRGEAPQVRHVRDVVALGLVGGGMRDAAADELVRGLPPSENLRLRQIAKVLLGVTFLPVLLRDPGQGKEDGSEPLEAPARSDGTPGADSSTSAA